MVLDNLSREVRDAIDYPHEGIYFSFLNGVPGRRVGIPGEMASQKTLEGKSFQVLGISAAPTREVNN